MSKVHVLSDDSSSKFRVYCSECGVEPSPAGGIAWHSSRGEASMSAYSHEIHHRSNVKAFQQ